MSKIIIVVLYVFISTCIMAQSSRLNTSSLKSFEQSHAQIEKELSKEKFDEFSMALDKLINNNLSKTINEKLQKGKPFDENNILQCIKEFNKKSADEIILKAKSVSLIHHPLVGIPFNRKLCTEVIKKIMSGNIKFKGDKYQLSGKLFDAAFDGLIYKDSKNNWILFPVVFRHGGLDGYLYAIDGIKPEQMKKCSISNKKVIEFNNKSLVRVAHTLIIEKKDEHWFYVHWNFD